MNKNLAELQYLAGVINENQYHELFGLDFLSPTAFKKDKILGIYNIKFDNNLMHIYPVKSAEGLSPELHSLSGRSHLDTILNLSDDQLQDFVDSFGDDFAKDKLDMHKELKIKFNYTIGDAKLKLDGDELQIDDGTSHCYDYKCHLKLTPEQVRQISK